MLKNTNNSITNLAAAIVSAAAEFEDVKRDGSASINTRGGASYSYKYATLANILQSVRPILAKHGLAVLQNAATGEDGQIHISTMLMHTSGEYLIFNSVGMPQGATAQETGSAITYGRRYHLLAVLGLAADDDDDGATAAPRQTHNASTAQRANNGTMRPITDRQRETLINMHNDRRLPLPDFDNMTSSEASTLIDQIKTIPRPPKNDKLTKTEAQELQIAAANDVLMGEEEPF